MIITKPQIKPKIMYSQANAARRLQISRITLWKAGQKGEIKPVIMEKGRTIYLGEDILNYWESKREVI